MALSNIYPIFNLLKYVKGLVLWSQSHRATMTSGNSRICRRSFGEGLVLMVYQKPETWNITQLIFLNETGQKDTLHDT